MCATKEKNLLLLIFLSNNDTAQIHDEGRGLLPRETCVVCVYSSKVHIRDEISPVGMWVSRSTVISRNLTSQEVALVRKR